MKPTILLIAVSILLLGIPDFCQADEKVGADAKISATLEKGIGQYKHENYDEALATLKKAKEENPQSSLTAYYIGLTYKQLQNYREAIPCLKDAVTFSPKIKGALLELIDCLYQLGKLEEAKEWIAQAKSDGIRPAQVAFLEGLVLLKGEKWEDAVEAFKNAKELDPSMSQTCNYQIGIAYLKGKKISEAQKAFTEVVITDPHSNMANFANEYVGTLARRKEMAKPFKFTFGTAWQYDDNVVLEPDNVSIVSNISDKADSREVYTASGEYNHMFNDSAGVRALYTFYYAKQNDLGFYDTVVNNFMIQPTLYFNKALLSLPSGYSHTLINDKAYLSTPYTSAFYNFMPDSSNMGQAFIRYQNDDFLWTSSTSDENRDGNVLSGGIGWYTFFARNKGFVNFRYAMDKDWTKGNNWEYLGNRVSATALIPVWDKLNFTVSGDIFFQDFTNSHTVYNVCRKDTVYTLSLLAAYKIFKNCEIQLQYTHINDNSNISVYQYTRNVYSAGVEIKF